MKKIFLFIGMIFICSICFAHTINWHVGDQIISTITCDSGDSITPPTAPAKTGYHFVRWKPDYTELEYIESTGTQYIDTAYTKAKTKDVEAQISITQTIAAYQIFYGLADDTQCALDKDGHWVNYGATSVGIVNANTWYNTKLDFTNRTLYVDGDAVAVGNEGTNTGGIKIFNTQYRSYARIKSFKVHGLNGNLICNMVPAKRNSDNVVGMYDTVSKQFFTNAGTGEFIAGPNIGDLQ